MSSDTEKASIAIAAGATLIGRIHRPDIGGQSVVALSGEEIIDITSPVAPTVCDLCELDDPLAHIRGFVATGEVVGSLAEVLANSFEDTRDPSKPWLLAPVDLQAVKAAGVTFVVSLLERVIEEQAKGSPEKAAAVRSEITNLIGEDLSKLQPGSDRAVALKRVLIEKGGWSQYLEVGIGPDAEIFTKCQPMSSVGYGADIGIHPISTWNNPEPEIVLIVSSTGGIVGAALGNDVNLRDVEGRSELLLGKAKDNNASCAIGPFVRLFDDRFGLDDVKRADVRLRVEGEDGFVLDGVSSMSQISRSPEDLVSATIGENHQYPDGFALFMGTMFAPIQDRDTAGEGFTHRIGDRVTISTETLGSLTNVVKRSNACAPWTFGVNRLMRNLAERRLI